MNKSDIKELTKSPFKGGNTDNYDKYFNDLKKIFDKNKDVSELDKTEALFRDIEKLKIKTKDPVKLKIYGRILEENDLLHYANIFYEKLEILENMNESMKKNVGDQVTIYWKGFSVSEGLIGSFIISRETHDRIEEEFGESISIDFYDENVEGDKIDTYEDIINAMKNTKYGRIVFESVGTIDLPKDIAEDLLPQVQKKKEEFGKFTVKDLEDMMLANGASLKLLDDTVSELVNLDFDFDTEDEDANDYTNESKLVVKFSDSDEFENAKKFFNDESSFYTDNINNEFMTFDFDVEDQSDMDVTEKEINKELKNKFKSYTFMAETKQTNESSRKSTEREKTVFLFLNDLKESGITNMFGAIPYMLKKFSDMKKTEAVLLLTRWMKNFNEEGDYDMVKESLGKEKIREMRSQIRRKYPKFKFSITGDYNSITVAIMSGPIDFMQNSPTDRYQQLNPYLIDREYGEGSEAAIMLKEIKDIISEGVYTLVDDGDYGKVPSHYYNIHIGKWDRPFVFTGQPEEVNEPVSEGKSNYQSYLKAKLGEFKLTNIGELNKDQWKEIKDGWKSEKDKEDVNEGFVNRVYVADVDNLVDKLYDYVYNIMYRSREVTEGILRNLILDLPFDLNTYKVETDNEAIEELAIVVGKDVYDLAEELSIIISDNKNMFEYEESKISKKDKEDVNEGFVNRAVVADIGPVLINKLKDYLINNYIDNTDKQFDVSHLLYLLGDLPFDLNTYEVETDSDSIIQLSKIFTKNINELANELSIVISDNKNMFEYEESKITESLSTKEDKIDYIIFYTDKDKSTLEQMSDAVINKVYAETVKNATGEIVDEETDCDFGIDTDDLSVSNLEGPGINRALIGKEDEYGNIMTEEELRAYAKQEQVSTNIFTKDEFTKNAKEYKESNFGEIVEHGFKVKNIHPDISEKKFITDDINEAYKQYKSFMNLYSFNEDSINKEVLSKDEFIEGLREYEIEGGFGSTIETGFELYYVPENTLGYKKKFKTNSKEEAYKQYQSFMRLYEDDTVQPMTDQINPEKSAKLRSVTVKYADGTVINTSMAANLTDEDIRNYFQIGSLFNVGSYPNDNLQPVEEVIINESNTINEAVNENHKQVMPYQDESMKPWVIYPDSVEAPEKEPFDITAMKNLISADNFLRFAYENLMTGDFYEDMTTMYDTYIKNDEVNLEKMKTYESYTMYIVEETLIKSQIANLILENMTSEITDDVKKQIYLNLNSLTTIQKDLKHNLALSTPEFRYDIKETFKFDIKNKLKEFRDSKITLESFNEGNVLDYNNNSVSALKIVLEQVSELFNTTDMELNSELSVVATLAILK